MAPLYRAAVPVAWRRPWKMRSIAKAGRETRRSKGAIVATESDGAVGADTSGRVPGPAGAGRPPQPSHAKSEGPPRLPRAAGRQAPLARQARDVAVGRRPRIPVPGQPAQGALLAASGSR